MKVALAVLCAAIAFGRVAQVRSEPYVHASDLYPYCSVDSRTDGRNCYISSRSQCEFRDLCVDNPGYIGRDRALKYMRNNKPAWRWWR
jgi:hypothetical protein